MSAKRPVCLVTGANSGVGYETTRRLAEEGWRVVMACRSEERGEAARDRLAGSVGAARLELELADLEKVTEVVGLADRVTSRHPALQGVVLNAGLYSSTLERTDPGFELTMAVNHLAHVLLALRVLPAVVRGGGRIVSVSSEGHRGARPHRAPLSAILEGEAWEGGMMAYRDSKLANILFAFELERRLRTHGVRADAVHPGVLATRIWENPGGITGLLARAARIFMDRPHVGGEAVSRLLLRPELADGGGRYFDETEEVEPSRDALDTGLAARMWEASLDALGLTFPSLPTSHDPPGREPRPGSSGPG